MVLNGKEVGVDNMPISTIYFVAMIRLQGTHGVKQNRKQPYASMLTWRIFSMIQNIFSPLHKISKYLHASWDVLSDFIKALVDWCLLTIHKVLREQSTGNDQNIKG